MERCALHLPTVGTLGPNLAGQSAIRRWWIASRIRRIPKGPAKTPATKSSARRPTVSRCHAFGSRTDGRTDRPMQIGTRTTKKNPTINIAMKSVRARFTPSPIQTRMPER